MYIVSFLLLSCIAFAVFNTLAPSPLKVILFKILDTLIGKDGYFTKEIMLWLQSFSNIFICIVILKLYSWGCFTVSRGCVRRWRQLKGRIIDEIDPPCSACGKTHWRWVPLYAAFECDTQREAGAEKAKRKGQKSEKSGVKPQSLFHVYFSWLWTPLYALFQCGPQRRPLGSWLWTPLYALFQCGPQRDVSAESSANGKKSKRKTQSSDKDDAPPPALFHIYCKDCLEKLLVMPNHVPPRRPAKCVVCEAPCKAKFEQYLKRNYISIKLE
jgi:hypothetical protein